MIRNRAGCGFDKSILRRGLRCAALALVLASCSMGGQMVTWDSFADVPIGASSNEVVEAVGKPYATHKKDDGSVEYEYIERFKVGYRNMQTRRYYILMKDGKVVSKRYEMNSPLPYYLESFDSYDMQTTHNEESPSESED